MNGQVGASCVFESAAAGTLLPKTLTTTSYFWQTGKYLTVFVSCNLQKFGSLPDVIHKEWQDYLRSSCGVQP